jgi:hypothetical protein
MSDANVNTCQAATEDTAAEPAKTPKPKSPSFLSKLLAPLKSKGPKSPKKEKTEVEVSYRAWGIFQFFFFARCCWSSIEPAFTFDLICCLGHSRCRALW